MNGEGWTRFVDPDYAFEFDYPTTTRDGRAVAFVRRPHPGGEAVHLSNDDGSEVYFELDRMHGRRPDEWIAFLMGDILERDARAWFGEVRSTQLCGAPASSIHFRFGRCVRWAILTEASDPCYRVILDPRSTANLAILGSLRRRMEPRAPA